MTLAAVQRPSQRGGKFADETVVWESEVAQLERETDEVGEKIGRVNAAVNKDCAVDVRVGEGGEGRRL